MGKTPRDFRLEKKLSIKELSLKSGVHSGTILKAETDGNVTMKSLIKISDGLSTPEYINAVVGLIRYIDSKE